MDAGVSCGRTCSFRKLLDGGCPAGWLVWGGQICVNPCRHSGRHLPLPPPCNPQPCSSCSLPASRLPQATCSRSSMRRTPPGRPPPPAQACAAACAATPPCSSLRWVHTVPAAWVHTVPAAWVHTVPAACFQCLATVAARRCASNVPPAVGVPVEQSALVPAAGCLARPTHLSMPACEGRVATLRAPTPACV